jgi:hypothetical protein
MTNHPPPTHPAPVRHLLRTLGTSRRRRLLRLLRRNASWADQARTTATLHTRATTGIPPARARPRVVAQAIREVRTSATNDEVTPPVLPQEIELPAQARTQTKEMP